MGGSQLNKGGAPTAAAAAAGKQSRCHKGDVIDAQFLINKELLDTLTAATE